MAFTFTKKRTYTPPYKRSATLTRHRQSPTHYKNNITYFSKFKYYTKIVKKQQISHKITYI